MNEDSNIKYLRFIGIFKRGVGSCEKKWEMQLSAATSTRSLRLHPGNRKWRQCAIH